MLATCLASAVPLLDLRGAGALDAVYREDGVPGNALAMRARRGLALGAAILLALATVLFATAPSRALLACALLALATVLAVPLTFAGVLRAAHALAERVQGLTILPVALSSLRATTLRSLALAATGAVALFGSVALGGARGDLLRGIEGFAHSYAADAAIWVGNPGDNQATVDFRADGLHGGSPGSRGRRRARLPGRLPAARIPHARRVWVIARPPGAAREVLDSQILAGSPTLAARRLGEGGWIAVSQQIAEEHHVGVGGTLVLPTPSGPARFRIAATTTNLAWSPGVIFMSTADYSRLWATSTPTALGVDLATRRQPGAGPTGDRARARTRKRPGSDDRAHARGADRRADRRRARPARRDLDAAADRRDPRDGGRADLGDLAAAQVAREAAPLGRGAAPPAPDPARRIGADARRRLPDRRRAGLYGQLVIDAYLEHVTGFPVARLGASFRPLEILALVILLVLAIVAVPGWFASRVSPTLALNEQ